MTRRANPAFPAEPFGLLLVEGGDERGVCEAVAGAATWAKLACRVAGGRDDLLNTARLARSDPNFALARSVGVLLDVEDDRVKAEAIAASALAVFGVTDPLAPGVFSTGSPRLGFFLVPDSASHGAIESLCRRAVRDRALAACVDQIVTCAGSPHRLQAHADKGWLRAYLGMTTEPSARFHQGFATVDGIDPEHAAFDPLRTFLRAL